MSRKHLANIDITHIILFSSVAEDTLNAYS
jgi:hypothetical protein